MTQPVSDADQLPIDVHLSETIVRAIVTPAHFDAKKGDIKTGVFRPRSPETSISVMRQLMGDDFCKNKACEIAAASPTQTYVGLLVITAAEIRAAGSEVADSREEFLGHADLDHGLPSPPDNDPGSAEDFRKMTDRCQALKKKSLFFPDPAPTVAGWAGEALQLASPPRPAADNT